MLAHGTTKVYAFATDKGKATAPQLAAAASLHPDVVGNSTDEFRRVFTDSVHADGTRAQLTLKGPPAQIDAGAAPVVKQADGKLEPSAYFFTIRRRSVRTVW